jgi:hypothetical protein
MEKKKQLKVKLERKPLKEAPFTILPKAIFHLRKDNKTRTSVFRLLLTACYFYSKSMTEDLEARITYSELMKILNCNSMNTITTILQFLEDSAIIVEKEYDPHNKYTTVILSHPTVLAERVQNATGIKVRENIIFKFPKILFLLPISPQAKSVLLYLYSKKNYPEDWEIPVTSREITEQLKLMKKNALDAIKELLKTNLITEAGKKGKTTTFKLIPPISIDEEKNKPTWLWPEETIQKAYVGFPFHPFWKLYIDNELIKEMPGGTNHQYRTDSNNDLTNIEPKLHQYRTKKDFTNIEPIPHQYRTDKRDNLTNIEPIPHQYRTDTSNQSLVYQQEKVTIEDYIEDNVIEDCTDDIYGGATEPSEKEKNFHSKDRKQKRISNCTKLEVDNSCKLANYKTISAVVSCIRKRLPDYVLSRITVPETWLVALKKFYPEEVAQFLGSAYIYLTQRTSSYSNINNPVGFLISLGSEKKVPDLKEFLQKFLAAAGYPYLYDECFRSSQVKGNASYEQELNVDLRELKSGLESMNDINSADDGKSVSKGECKEAIEKRERKRLKVLVVDSAKLASLFFKRKGSEREALKDFSEWLREKSVKVWECPERIKSLLKRKFDDKLICYSMPEDRLEDAVDRYKELWNEVVVKVIDYQK